VLKYAQMECTVPLLTIPVKLVTLHVEPVLEDKKTNVFLVEILDS
jgi:hypothetical protein